MGNSIIMLGAYGGLKDKYKYTGNYPDNFGFRQIHKQEWLNMDDNEAWQRYLKRHPKTKLTQRVFFKQRARQRNQRISKSHKHKKRRLSPTEVKKQSDLAYALKESSLKKSSSKLTRSDHTKIQRKIKSTLANKPDHHRFLTNKNLKKRQYAARFKENVMVNPFFARKYFYQEKNTVKIGDVLAFKMSHTCRHNSRFRVALCKDGIITIVCICCFARYRLTYKQMLLLQYNANNYPISDLKEP